MPRLLKVAALLLATLWLPATLHCQLEGLGFDSLFGCADTPAGHADSRACADDGCQTIEAGQFVLTKQRLDLAAPALLACACSFCLFEFQPPVAAADFTASRQDVTLPLQRTWQFTRRAAAPPRAPGSL